MWYSYQPFQYLRRVAAAIQQQAAGGHSHPASTRRPLRRMVSQIILVVDMVGIVMGEFQCLGIDNDPNS